MADRGGSQVLWFEYSGDQIAAVSDAAGRRVEYGYTGGLLTSVTDVTGGITRFEYDGQGRIDKKIDPENYASTIAYDKYGHVSAVNDAAGRGYRFEYDMNEGTKETYVRITAPGGAIREIWYNRDGEPTRVDLNGRTIEKIARDGRDLIITDEKGRVTRKNYDEWDNLTQVLYPDGTSVSYEYEHTFSRRTRETDENGIATAYVYDDIGNMIQKTEAVGTADERITEYTYDGDGNLLTTTRLADADTAAAETVMAYDALGNLVSITDPEGGVTRFTAHDIMGNVLTKEDARGKLWQYALRRCRAAGGDGRSARSNHPDLLRQEGQQGPRGRSGRTGRLFSSTTSTATCFGARIPWETRRCSPTMQTASCSARQMPKARWCATNTMPTVAW